MSASRDGRSWDELGTQLGVTPSIAHEWHDNYVAIGTESGDADVEPDRLTAVRHGPVLARLSNVGHTCVRRQHEADFPHDQRLEHP